MIRRYILQAKQPILVGSTQAGNYRVGIDYIPGATIRGAVAAALLRSNDLNLYSKIFEEASPPIFYDGIPCGDGTEHVPMPFPITAVTCKRFPGRKQDAYEHSQHGVYDTLISSFAHANSPLPICQKCGEEMQPHYGFYVQERRGYSEHHEHLVPISTTHVGINRRRQVAEEGVLYTRVGQTVKEQHNGQHGARFMGLAHLTGDQVKALSGHEYWIGANRSRGMGAVTLSIESWDSSGLWGTLSNRLQHFNKALRQQIKLPMDRVYFTLDTLTGLVVSRVSPTTIEALRQMIAHSLESTIDLKCESHWSRYEIQGGWHAAAGLPRTNQTVIYGSFLFSVQAVVNDAQLLAALGALEATGLGMERERGFGLVICCDPFHLKSRMEESI